VHRAVLVDSIEFVRYYNKGHVELVCWLGVFKEFFFPVREGGESALLVDVPDQNCTVDASVVGFCEGSKTLLTCGIPNLHIDFYGVYLYFRSLKVPRARRHLQLSKIVIYEFLQQASFPNPRIPQHYDFKLSHFFL
jgi:hypothetical protein